MGNKVDIKIKGVNMILIILSLITGFVSIVIGGATGEEIFMYLLGFVGVLSPALFVLQKIYLKLEKLEKKLE